MKPKTKLRKKRSGLTCPACAGELRVVITRPGDTYVYRRRECAKCGDRVTTVERIVGTASPLYTHVPNVVSSVHHLLQTLGITVAQFSEPVTLSIEDKK